MMRHFVRDVARRAGGTAATLAGLSCRGVRGISLYIQWLDARAYEK